MHLCIFEDRQVKNLHPLTYLNPVFELKCGCTTLREKIVSQFPLKNVTLLTRAYLSEFVQESFPSLSVNNLPADDTIFINGRVLADKTLSRFIHRQNNKEFVAFHGTDIVAAFLKRKNVETFVRKTVQDEWSFHVSRSLPSLEINCTPVEYPWELVSNNADEIEKDFLNISRAKKKKAIAGKLYKGAHLLNRNNIIIGEGSVVKPGAVLDAEHGPIVIGKHVAIQPNAVIEGPAFVGDYSTIKIGAKIYPGTSIGAHCKIGGEVTRSIIQSYSNKAHDGFVGDSYIGSWVNIGADTNTSNLKNTYGNVDVYINGTPVDSGAQFVGLTMGDHSKSGINAMFTTGAVAGVSCNIFGAGVPSKYLPSFSWGSPDSFTVFEIEKSIEIARRMMSRRGITMSKSYEAMMRHVFNLTRKERREWLKK